MVLKPISTSADTETDINMQKFFQVLERQGGYRLAGKQEKCKNMAYDKVLQKFPFGAENNSTGIFAEKKEKIIFKLAHAVTPIKWRKASNFTCRPSEHTTV